MDFAKFLYKSTKEKGANMHIHIEVDTGMGRTGLDYDSALSQIQEISSYKSLIIDGIFTHFPSADNNPEFTQYQIERFKILCDKLNQLGIKPFLRHASNSSGFLNFSDADFDMIRPGLSVYGINPIQNSNSQARNIELVPVMSLRSRIVNIRTVLKGGSISYGRKYITLKDSIIAVITAGYGDGYPYALNNGEVIIKSWENSKRAKIVGSICMDLVMIDVTGIPGVKIGDIVTLLGTSDESTITAHELSKWANTIPYEITCRVSPRVPRVFLRDQKIVSIRNLLRVIGDHKLTT
jgi:alanine racemase